MCHRYPALGRYNDKGDIDIYYVDDQNFEKSVHGILNCTDCHKDITKIPHVNAKKVDCSTKCHLKEPSTQKEFSHINMHNKFESSVHSKMRNGNLKANYEDLPSCKYCHNNRKLQGMIDTKNYRDEAFSQEILTRCKGCHTKQGWADRFLKHLSDRTLRKRSQSEIVFLCASCHEDQEKMSRHGLESVATFKDTFHWTLVKYNVQNAPDCMSCHIPRGYSTHDIKFKNNDISPINKNNIVNTCSNQGGMQTCHPDATEYFAKGRVHAYGEKAKLLSNNEVQSEDSILFERAKNELSKDDILKYKILKFLTLIYKLFIAMVIFPMFVHQVLDYNRIKINIKKTKKRT
ncbi:MAG: hypothetical protein ABIA04_09320 [Pseudomonadota bacterium]